LNLNSSFPEAIGEDILGAFSQLPCLEVLDLRKTCVGDTDLLSLADIKNLTSLDLSYWDNLTNARLAHFSKIHSLTLLDLTCCSALRDAGLMHLKDLNNLQKLRLAGCDEITGKGLIHLAELPNLLLLDWGSRHNLTFADLANLASFAKLTSLELAGCTGLTVDVLRALVEVRGLKSLLLGDSDVTDDALVLLQACPNLTSLKRWPQFRGLECPGAMDPLAGAFDSL
jgi:hypothetical protein